MTELTPGVLARRKRAEAKRSVESTVFTKPIKAIKLCSWEEVEQARIGEPLINGIKVEADPTDTQQEGFFIPYSAKKYFGTVVQIGLETFAQDPTPDGRLEENGMKIYNLAKNYGGLTMVPMTFADEIIE